MTKRIEVTIDTDGKTKIATSGFVGNECLKATLALENALGQKVADQATAEMNASNVQTNTHTA